MTGSHQRDKSAEAFWRQLSLKEVHQSSCLKQNLFHSRMIRPVVGGGGPPCLIPWQDVKHVPGLMCKRRSRLVTRVSLPP